MDSINIQFNDNDFKELENIIDYHKDILGLNSEISEVLYLEIKQEMFTMINLFSLLDVNFKDRIMSLLLEDIISLIIYFDKLNDLIKKHNDKTKENRFKELKKTIIPLINTKMYYLDTYIFKKIEDSKFLQSFLNQKFSFPITNSIEFIAYCEDEFAPLINTNYKIDEINLRVKYKEEDLNKIKLLDSFMDRRENFLLRKLIDSKKAISFFKGMEASDIKYVVKDVEFLKYKLGENIILKDDESKEIYFLLSGKCNVQIDSKIIGRIERSQLFGEFSSILNEKRNATVIASEEVTVLRFNLAFELFDKEPYPFTKLYKNIMNELIKKIVKLNKRS